MVSSLVGSMVSTREAPNKIPVTFLIIAGTLGIIPAVLIGRELEKEITPTNVLLKLLTFISVWAVSVFAVILIGRQVRIKHVIRKGLWSATCFGLCFGLLWYALAIWFYNWPTNLLPEQPLTYESGPSNLIAAVMVAFAVLSGVLAFRPKLRR